MLPRVDLDHLSSADLKALVIRLMERIAGLEHTVAALREEIARLKGLKGPPSIKPSGMEQASEDAPPKEGRRKRRRRGRGAANLSVHEDRVVKIAVPAGSRFKGYEDFLVQDVIVRAHVNGRATISGGQGERVATGYCALSGFPDGLLAAGY